MSDLPQENILDEIMGRDPAYSPEPADQRPPSGDAPADPAGGTEPAGPAPEGKVPAGEKRSKPSSVYIYLAVLFGAAFMMLLLAYFVQRRNSATAISNLRISTNATREELLEQNQQLQERVSQLEARAAQAEAGRETLEDDITGLTAAVHTATAQKRRLDYLWYVQQFMEAEDHPMAALAMAYSAGSYFSDVIDTQYVPSNPMQRAQYQRYEQELIERGYLDCERAGSSPLTLMREWNPEQNPTMAALGVLWCSLDSYYVSGSPYPAAQWLAEYEHYAFDFSGARLSERIYENAGSGTIRLYEQLVHDLTEGGYLIETGSGWECGLSDLIGYTLPFALPTLPDPLKTAGR